MSEDFIDLARHVYCLFGTPVDNISMAEATDRIEAAIQARAPYLIATPNINFLVNAATDEEFRNTLIFSDLCLPDGMWLVRLGRLLGIPFADRVAGADLLEALKLQRINRDPVKLCFFGGSDAAGRAAGAAINARDDGLRCVGAVNPGFGSLEEMSADRLVSAVNATGADFLMVALGAKKGQLWLHTNHTRLTAPVRAHLGATINFYAGAIRRAPQRLRRLGLEWAWRIKEEPLLWRRYAYDGAVLALLCLQRVTPLLLWSLYLSLRRRLAGERLTIGESVSHGRRVISLGGALTAANAGTVAAALRSAMRDNEILVLDLSGARAVDARFAGMLCMLRKTLARRGRPTRITGAPVAIRWLLALYGFVIPRPAPESDSVPAAGVSVPVAAAE